MIVMGEPENLKGLEGAIEVDGIKLPVNQPYYDSIAQASAAMGVSVKQLRRAKKEGAPGFRGSRVYPGELVPWLEEWAKGVGTSPADEMERLERRKLLAECERIELKLQNERGRLYESDEVKGRWLQHMRAARHVLTSIPSGLAPQLAGHPTAVIQRKISEAIEGGLAQLRGNPYGDGAFPCPHCKQSIDPSRDFQKAKEYEHGARNTEHGASNGPSVEADGKAPDGTNGPSGTNGSGQGGAVPRVQDGLRQDGQGQPGQDGGRRRRRAAPRRKRHPANRKQRVRSPSSKGSQANAPARPPSGTGAGRGPSAGRTTGK